MDQKRFIAALVICAGVLLGWNYLFPANPNPEQERSTNSSNLSPKATGNPSLQNAETASTNQASSERQSQGSAATQQQAVVITGPLLALLFFAACIMAVLIRRNIRGLERSRGKRKGILYHVLKNSFEFLLIFIIVSAVYIGLWVFASMASKYGSLQFLISLETFFSRAKSVFSDYFKLSAIKIFILFTGLYVLAILRIPLQLSKTWSVYSVVEIYQRWARRVYTALVLLCLFTLFGTQVGNATVDELKLQIKSLRDGYADARKQVQAAISEEVARKLYDKAYASVPPAYQKALSFPETSGDRLNNLTSSYESAQREYGIRSGKSDSVIRLASSNQKAASEVVTDLEVSREIPDSVRLNALEPLEMSHRSVETARVALDRYRRSAGSRVITFLKMESGRRLTLHAPKVLTSEIRTELFSSWIKAYPIVEPLVDIFVGAVNEDVKTRLEQVIDESTRSIIDRPEKIETVVDEKSSRIVEATTIRMSSDTTEKVNRAVSQAEREEANIEEAQSEIADEIKRVEASRIEQVIAELRNASEDVREKAASSLSEMGGKLTKPQVDELIRMMRTGTQRWSKFLYREGHCRFFEYTSLKYYAAKALEDMKSQLVTEKVVLEARTSESEAKTTERITDPGWI